MKKIFLSLTKDHPKGFEYRVPNEEDIENNCLCLALENLNDLEKTPDNIKDRATGVILTKGDSFSCKKIGPKLWHLSAPANEIMAIEEINCFLEIICSEAGPKAPGSHIFSKPISEDLNGRLENYRNVFNSTNEAIFIHNATTGKILDVNDRMLEMFGYSYDEALNSDVGQLSENISPYTQEEAVLHINRAMTDGPQVFYWNSRKKTGELFFCEVSLKKIRVGEKDRILSVVRDISERKRAEEALRMSEEKFRSLAENSQDIIVRFDKDLRHIYANPEALSLISLKLEDIVGKTHAELGFDKKFCSLMEKRIRGVLEQGSSENTVIEFNSPKAQLFLDFKLFPEFDSKGNIASVLGVARDISAVKLTQEALQKSEQLFRGYFELGLIGMSTTTPDKRWIHFNDMLCDMLGYSREEMANLTWEDISHPQSLENEMIHYNRVISGEIDGYNMDKKYIRKDGSTVYVNISVSCHRNEDRQVEYFIAMIQDISERKKAEKALRNSEALLFATIESLPFDIFAIGENKRYILQNSASRKTWGSVVGKSLDEIKVSPEIRSIWLESNMKAFRGEQVTGEAVYKIKDKQKTFYQIIAPIYNEAPEKGIVGVNIDITEFKKAQEALSESEERLRTLINGLPDMVCFKDGEGKWLEANENYLKLYGLEGIDYRGKKNTELLELTDYYKNRIKVRDDSDEKTWDEGKITRRDEIIPKPDGSVLIFDSIKIPMFYPDGRRRGIIKVGRDITERKKVEDALIRSMLNFEAFFGTVSDLIFILDENGRIVHINRAVTKRLGFSEEEIMGRPISNLMKNFSSSDEKITIFSDFKGDTSRDEVQLLSKNGETIDVETITFRGEWDGKPALFRISRDVSELKLSEKKFATAFKTNSAVMTISTVKDGVYLDVNESFLKLSGYSREEVIGHSSMELGIFNDPEDREKLKKIFLEKGYVRDFESKVKKKNGDIVYGILSMDRFSIGDESCWLTVMADLTERRKTEKEKLEMERRLLHSQKLESLGVLAGGIAHDFNNLLTGILGNLDLAILSIPQGSSAKTRIEQAVQASYRAVDLTRQMLAYSGKGKFEIKPVDLDRIVKENSDLFRASITRTISFNISSRKSLPLIEADPGQIQQVIMNLITNASEAIGTGTGVISVSTGVMECDEDFLRSSRLEEKPEPGEFVFVEVTDTGCGMDEETQNRIFEPFFTTKFTGRGLGMAAVLGIIRGHRGAIMVDSKPGQGSLFRVLFPIMEKLRETEMASSIKDITVVKEPEKRGTILVVDDEDHVRELCVDFLKVFGFETLSACDGNEALEIFKEHKNIITCVILDLTMPGLDGAGTFRELKKIREDIKIILSSGYNEHEATILFSGQGLSGFIQKPYRLGELKDKLDEVLKK